MQNEGRRPLAPPYISFKTLLGVLDRMEKEGIPPRIDRSFLTGMSGGYQTQVLNALKYLGLISGDGGDVSENLVEVVDPNERRKTLAQILVNKYPEAAKLGEENATHGQLAEWFREEFSLAAETQDKAIAFYLQGARYCEVPLSPFFKKPRVSSGTAKKRTSKRKPREKPSDQPLETPSDEKHGRSMFKVTLGDGGTLTLLGDFDPFALEPEDRKFVFEIVDKMRDHQGASDEEPIDGGSEEFEDEE